MRNVSRAAASASGQLVTQTNRTVRRLRGHGSLTEAVNGRTVVITGASSGIGRATAIKCANAGARVVLVARREDELTSLAQDIQRGGGWAEVRPTDLTDQASVEGLVEQIVTDHGGADVLVNNAGMSIRKSIMRSIDRLDRYERTIELNYLAAVRLTLGLIPAMVERGGGHVVNVTTMGVQARAPRFSAYLASKAALEMFGNVARSELHGSNVTFSNVRIPLTRTPMIAPNQMWDIFPALEPEEAAALVCRGIATRDHEVNVMRGNVMEALIALSPRTADRVLNNFHRTFPDAQTAASQEGQRAEVVRARVARIAGRFM